jgi:ABC-2 type transport system ATP-binding protein
VSTSAPPAIEVRGLTKRYGEVLAVDALDLEVAPGETLALLGPNGAGKTTTLECCEGYRRPDAGTVRVFGLDPQRDAARLRPRVGLMLQEGGIYPMVRPLEVLRLYAAFFADPLRPEDLLERVGLADATGTRYRDLSGGQKQRLSLALAVIGRPELVFLDEPTAGLDPAARRRTWEHVRELRDDGVTVVLTTHLLDEAEELADRVVIIDRGRPVADGSPADLVRGDQETVTFTTDGSPVDTEVLARTLGVPVRPDGRDRYRVASTGSPRDLAALAAALAEARVQLLELRVGHRNLEDVFLRLTDAPTAERAGPRR